MLRHLGLIAYLGACSSPPAPTPPKPLPVPAPMTGSGSGSGSGSCPPDWCAGNSPEIASQGLWDVNVKHLPNAQGFVLHGLTKSGRFYSIEVRDSAFVASDAAGTTTTGQGLVGSTIWLQQGGTLGAWYGIKIVEVGAVNEMVPPRARVETYVLRWSLGTGKLRVLRDGTVAEEPRLGADDSPVCRPWGQVIERQVRDPVTSPDGRAHPTLRTVYSWPPADIAWDESAEIPPFNAVVFEGDRIDATTRTLTSHTPDDDWFNIGCARHTLSKMRLSRNTLHTVAHADWRPVQATLKMLSADYCGHGKALTVTGTPLVWQESWAPHLAGSAPTEMTYRFPPPPGSLEARWDENGAVCLDTPRLAVHGTPNIKQLISQDCAPSNSDVAVRSLRLCKDPDPLHTGGESFATIITTANYTAPP